jgi:hypothetical protein
MKYYAFTKNNRELPYEQVLKLIQKYNMLPFIRGKDT